MQTQAEIELEAYGFGKERMAKAIDKNEAEGRADTNPYAQAIYRRFVLPLADIIRAGLVKTGPGRHAAHVHLLSSMDPEATAYIAVRAAMTATIEKNDGGRTIIAQVGRAVYHEHLLTHFADMNPELFYTLTNDFEKRSSKNERHRMTVYKMQAQKAGLVLPEWGSGDRDVVGAYLLEQLASLGMLEVKQVTLGAGRLARTKYDVHLTEQVAKLVDSISDFVIESTPYFLPCVEKPRDWTDLTDGGFHTQEMRRLMPFAIKAHPSLRDHLRNADLSKELRALNTLQSTKWRINSRLLDAVRNVHDKFDMEEVISSNDAPKPEKPLWLVGQVDLESLDDARTAEFKLWKRRMAQWYTDAKQRGVKWGRFYNAMRVAQKFRDYSALYFVYFMDFRGRKYVQTTGVSPQGSDLQKALLEFAEGKPLHTQAAKDWFCITGANRFGADKLTLPDRVKWVKDRHEQILAFAADPVANSDWTDADKPLQFLAWCFEYADWTVFGDNFLSRISVGMDGSCNGLQNFSAMLRDEVGGRATNLLPPEVATDTPNDIYGLVAVRTMQLLRDADADDLGYRARWLEHGVNRTLVKRSVMTLPYGSTRFSCAEFIVGDYMKAGKCPEFTKAEYAKAANYLSHLVWRAIADVVVKAREAMDWLQRAALELTGEGYQYIHWITPSGFPVVQAYWEVSVHQISTKLCGKARLKVHKDTDKVDRNRHKNGIAPNFVHSLDASHLTLTTLAGASEGITAFHMVHDDFGTHAADADTLYRIIREQFVNMYTGYCPLEAFHAQHPHLDPRPKLGNLDIRQVLDSPYFFS
jgi:DNA-directed RNA polymerase